MRPLAVIGFFLIWMSFGVTANAQFPVQETFAGRVVDLISGNSIPGVTATVTQNCFYGNGSNGTSGPLGEVQSGADGRFSLTYTYNNSPYCHLVTGLKKSGYIFAIWNV